VRRAGRYRLTFPRQPFDHRRYRACRPTANADDNAGRPASNISAEEKIRIFLDGLRGEATIAELCHREGIAESLYYSWSKEVPRSRQAASRQRRDLAGH